MLRGLSCATAINHYYYKPFPLSELRRFLPEKTFDLWERIKQDKAIEQAGLEGLEVRVIPPTAYSIITVRAEKSCPYCHYSIIIENEYEKLFRCQNEDCRAVSCRNCKKPVRCRRACSPWLRN